MVDGKVGLTAASMAHSTDSPMVEEMVSLMAGSRVGTLAELWAGRKAVWRESKMAVMWVLSWVDSKAV